MKKLFVCLAMVVVMFAAGITLSACGSNMVKLHFSIEEESESLVQVVVKHGETIVEGRGNNYNLEKGLNLRVEVVAKEYGVDFSELVVKANGAEKSIIKNKDYSCAYGSENLVYGTFTLPSVEEDVDVSISGARAMSVTYNFDVENADDETAIANMKNAFIDLDGSGDYINLYEFLSGPQIEINKIFTEQNFNSFNLRFGNPESGDDIFEIYNSNAFRVRADDGEEHNATYQFYTSAGYYVVTFPNVEKEKYTIVVDFKDLAYKQYAVFLPEDNINYSAAAPEFLSYDRSDLITISKSTLRDTLVYDDMRVYINELELELHEDCDVQNDAVLRFVVPDKITPFSTSLYREPAYTIRVEGISYIDEAYSVKLIESFDKDQEEMMEAKLFLLDDYGDRIGEIPLDGGAYTVVKGERIALFWQYRYDEETNSFVSKYDLFDFDVLMGDVVLIEGDADVEALSDEEEKKDPEKEEEKNPDPNPEQPEEPEIPKYQIEVTTLSLGGKIDWTFKETQIVEIADGYMLTAYYDEKKDGFAEMKLEFSCENDKEISFGNFKNFAQDINISFDFEDEKVSSVEYGILDSDEGWVMLDRNEAQSISVEAGQQIIFRLGGTAFVDAAKYSIENKTALLGEVEVSSYNNEGVYYTEFAFVVSNHQFSNVQGVKLVSVDG